MHTRTKSACVVLACSVLLIMAVAAGVTGPARPVQADTRTANSTEVILISTLSAAAASRTAAVRPAARYVVQPGDTLSGIAFRLAVRGGWQALYAANRPRIGPDPNVIHPGAVLVLPSQRLPVRYTVVPGDTLTAIAAMFAVRGGWPALYAANRRVIGPDPDVIRPGEVLTAPLPAAPSPAAPKPARRPVPPPSAPGSAGHRPLPGRASASGMPEWLTAMLLVVGLLIGVAFITGLVLVIRRRREQAARAGRFGAVGSAPLPSAKPLPTRKARIVLADHDRLVVAHSMRDGMVCVLRPPGEDPKAILRAARLVLPEDPYRELAQQLGMPASWPIVLADHDRLVVAHSMRDGVVCVLRPPGEDPKAILRAARLVLPEDPYAELAEQLGVPASWPME